MAKRRATTEFAKTRHPRVDRWPDASGARMHHTNSKNVVRSVCVGDRIDLLTLQDVFENFSESGDTKLPRGMSVLVPFDDQVALTQWFDTNEIFIFDFGVIVGWGLSDAELDEVIDSLIRFVTKPIAHRQDMERDFVFFSRADIVDDDEVRILQQSNDTPMSFQTFFINDSEFSDTISSNCRNCIIFQKLLVETFFKH